MEQLLSRQSFAAVTLDLSMPHVSGRELLVHLMQNYPDIFIQLWMYNFIGSPFSLLIERFVGFFW